MTHPDRPRHSRPTGPGGEPPPMRVTVRTDEDLLALAPVLLGFWPDQDIVLFTFGARRPFHARLDLPPAAEQDAATTAGIVASLVEPVRRHRVQAVVLLFVTATEADAEAAWPALAEAMAAAGVGVVSALVADGRRLRRLDEPGPWRDYDVGAHPWVVRAMVEGRIGYADREQMVAALQPDPVGVAAVQVALEAGAALPDCAVLGPEEALALAARLSTRATEPSDADVAALLRGLHEGRAWGTLQLGAGRDERARRLWVNLLTRAPRPFVADVAATLGYASWQAGDGAMAWVALDRALAADPQHAAALRLAGLLQQAVPPAV